MKGIDHIAIAVPNLEEASRFYQDVLGLHWAGVEALPEQKVRIAMFHAGAPGGAQIELLEPMSPDSPVAKFLKERGPGIHHICLEVDDLEAEMARLRSRGTALVDNKPRSGGHGTRIAFVHPRAAGGVLIELRERRRK